MAIRAGQGPEYLRWLDLTADRSFDLLLSYYAEPSPGVDMRADMVVAGGFNKLSSFADLVDERGAFYSAYRAIGLFDDDIATDMASLERLYAIFSDHELELAQAALHPDSFHSFAITLSHPTFLLRYTSWVEVMMPVFSPSSLSLCLSTFRETASTWGADLVWPHVLGHPTTKIAVIDDVVMRHEKPVDLVGGAFYQKLRAIGVNPFRDKKHLLEKYGLRERIFQHGGLLKQRGRAPVAIQFRRG